MGISCSRIESFEIILQKINLKINCYLAWRKQYDMLPVRRFGRHCRGIQILLHFTYNLTHQYLTTENYKIQCNIEYFNIHNFYHL